MLLFPKLSVTNPCPIHRALVLRDEWARHKSLRVLAALALLLPLTARAGDKPRPAPPVKPAAEYPANDPHPNEKVTIAADPCDDEDNCKFFRLPYVQHGFLPVRVIITNDRDQPLDLTEVRIQFFPAEGAKEAAATDDDLNRRLFHGKDATGTRLPIIPITIHHQPVDQKILNDDADFGFQSTIVPPHSTRAGYVFYDTKYLEDPYLKGAELYVKEMRYMDAKNQMHELFAFSLPFDTWLAAQPKPEPKPAPPAK
jgi:hypothetical protein